MENTVTRIWKVYGMNGHRQAASFGNSVYYDWSKNGKTRVLEVINSDRTGTNEYSIVRIIRNTEEECERELDGQLSDGIFENCRYGNVEEITIECCLRELQLK